MEPPRGDVTGIPVRLRAAPLPTRTDRPLAVSKPGSASQTSLPLGWFVVRDSFRTQGSNTVSNDYDDDFDLDGDGGISDLRKAYRKAQRQIKELTDQNNSLMEQGRGRAVRDVLAAKGVRNPDKIAKLIPSTAADEAAVSEWLDEYADVFGVVSDGGSGESSGGAPQGVSQEDVDAFASISQAGTGAPAEAEADLMARIQAADSPDALAALLRNG